MLSKNRYKGVDSYALFCIRQQVNILLRHPCFTDADAEDLEQELVLHFLKEVPRFDPALSDWKLHVTMVIRKYAINLRLHAETQKRGGRERPLSFTSSSPEEADKEATISSDDGLWGDPFAKEGYSMAELRLDFQKAFLTLPPHLQTLCTQLATHTPSEIAAATGQPRTTISSAVTLLRRHLKDAGLDVYLPPVSSHSEEIVKVVIKDINKQGK